MNVEELLEVPCETCKHRRRVAGSCHIQCANPPANIYYVGFAGPGGNGTFDERGAPNFDTDKERRGFAWKVAKDEAAVVRCLWPGCGPFCKEGDFFGMMGFDLATVFACCNYEKK